MPQGLELFLRRVRVQNSSVEVDDHVVVYQGDHGEHCLSGPEVMHIKALKAVALLKVLDHVLTVGTRALGSPDLLWRC